MYAVRCHLADVRCAESAGYVHSQVQVVAEVADGTGAARHAVEVAAEVVEAQHAVVLQLVALHVAVVVAHATVQGPASQRLADGGVEAEVEQPVVGNQVLVAVVARLLVHAVHARRPPPSPVLVGQVSQVVGHRVQLQLQAGLVVLLLILAAHVLLVSHDGLEVARREVQRIVPHHLVVLHLLEGQRLAVGLHVVAVGDEFARLFVTLTLYNAGRQVVDGTRHVRVAPLPVHTQHQAARPLVELRARHVAVVPVLIGVRHLLAETTVPHQPLLVARHGEGVAEEPVVGLILGGGTGAHGAQGHHRLGVQDDDARHGIRPVHQRGRTLQYLDRVDAVAIHLHAVLVAPLLALLSDAVAHDHHAVVAQSADDGLRDAAARGQLCHAGLVGYGVNDVGSRRGAQLLRSHQADGRRRVLQLGVARDARHHQFVQLQVAEEHVGRVVGVMLLFLGCHSGTYTQQWQNDDGLVHVVILLQ